MDFNFDLQAEGPVTRAFKMRGVKDFSSACELVRSLPYKRNRDRTGSLAVLEEGCGTCSTKHALLKRLADENNAKDVLLMLGIFRMYEKTSPRVKPLLEKYRLPYLPEAHNYLVIHGKINDYTGKGFFAAAFESELLTEMKIEAHEASEFKVQYHQDWLESWRQINYPSRTLQELWQIREECIALLQC